MFHKYYLPTNIDIVYIDKAGHSDLLIDWQKMKKTNGWILTVNL